MFYLLTTRLVSRSRAQTRLRLVLVYRKTTSWVVYYGQIASWLGGISCVMVGFGGNLLWHVWVGFDPMPSPREAILNGRRFI